MQGKYFAQFYKLSTFNHVFLTINLALLNKYNTSLA